MSETGPEVPPELHTHKVEVLGAVGIFGAITVMAARRLYDKHHRLADDGQANLALDEDAVPNDNS